MVISPCRRLLKKGASFVGATAVVGIGRQVCSPRLFCKGEVLVLRNKPTAAATPLPVFLHTRRCNKT